AACSVLTARPLSPPLPPHPLPTLALRPSGAAAPSTPRHCPAPPPLHPLPALLLCQRRVREAKMPPGRGKKGQTKAQTTEEPLTEIERERARTIMKNNQMLQSLGLTALASIVNQSSAKSKRVAREDSGSLYEPEAMEDIEHGVVDKV
ncbi:unnamed protein product, partial [Urochloa humidicola]